MGLTGTAGLRFCLMQLVTKPKLYSAKAQRVKMIVYFTARKTSLVVKFFYLKGVILWILGRVVISL